MFGGKPFGDAPQPRIIMGPELVSDPFLINASTLEVQSNGGGTVEKRTDTPPPGFNSYLRCTAGDTSFERAELVTDITSFVVGKRYLVKSIVRTQSVSGSDQGFSNDPTFITSDTSLQYVDQGISDWQLIQCIYTADLTSGTPRIYVNRSGGSASDALDIAYLSVTQALV